MAELMALIICIVVFSPFLFLPFIDNYEEEDPDEKH